MNKERREALAQRVRYMRLDWGVLDQLTSAEIISPDSNVEWVDELCAARDKLREIIETLEEALK